MPTETQVIGVVFETPQGRDIYIGRSLQDVLALVKEEESRTITPRKLPSPTIISLDDLRESPTAPLTHLDNLLEEIRQGNRSAAYVGYTPNIIHQI